VSLCIVLLAAQAPSQERLGGVKQSSDSPQARYWVYVANESSDLISLIRYGPEGIAVERDIPVGIMPADIDGAHGLSVEPGGRHYYLTIAHGTPNGQLWKFRTGDNTLADSVTLGRFPASIGITPDASLAFVVNFNLHGDPEPSSASAVYLPDMLEVERIETCVRPHGSRVNRSGTRVYLVCAGDDQLVEVSVQQLSISRRLSLRPGVEGELPVEMSKAETSSARCMPTWVVSSYDDLHLYVACNAHADILEIDAEGLSVRRRFQAGKGPYNLAATSDGRLLLATNKGAQSVSIIDLRKGEEIARVPTTRPITHGVTLSSDNRYAFVSNEAVGAVRGTVDVIDLGELTRVASVEVHFQPGGIDFWKMEPLERN
jgi:DNA-binding beta-propeller fold protein YncE